VVERVTGLGPLGDGARVAIAGGGPGGAVCALALLRGARARGIRIEVSILTPRRSHPHGQPVGVLSPPLQRVLREQVGVELRSEILERRIAAYALHGDAACLDLPLDDDGGESTFASPRAELDALLLEAAEAAGAQVLQTPARDVEFGSDELRIYSDAGCMSADALVGAFGLEPGLGMALAKRVGYVAPPHLEALVINAWPCTGKGMPVLREDTVHAFLPRLDCMEFGALIPNTEHVAIVVAGLHVRDASLADFLSLSAVRALLGSDYTRSDPVRAIFPNGLAGHAYADRFITVGDAAGLVRPFKGKGIYAATITGIRAATTMLEFGVSRDAFSRYLASCRDLVLDVHYGRLIRVLALVLAKRLSFDTVLSRAQHDAFLRQSLFLAVSGHGNSREIFWLAARPRTAAGLLADSAQYVWSGARSANVTATRQVQRQRVSDWK
jgi:flavin-dependent dehydrogenase